MKKTLAAISVALVMSVAFVSGVLAAQSKPMAPPAKTAQATFEKFSGVINKIDAAKKEIVVKQGKDEKSFYWGDHTKFMQGDKEVSFSALKKGTDVTVEYNKEGAKLMAERIDVNTPKTSG